MLSTVKSSYPVVVAQTGRLANGLRAVDEVAHLVRMKPVEMQCQLTYLLANIVSLVRECAVYKESKLSICSKQLKRQRTDYCRLEKFPDVKSKSLRNVTRAPVGHTAATS